MAAEFPAKLPLVCTHMYVPTYEYISTYVEVEIRDIADGIMSIHLGVAVSTLQLPKSSINGEYPNKPFVLSTSSGPPYSIRKSRCFIADTVTDESLLPFLPDRAAASCASFANLAMRVKSVGKSISQSRLGGDVR